MRELSDEPKKKIKTRLGVVEISNAALEELKYLHKGGASTHPLWLPELKSLGAVCKIEYNYNGSGVSHGCMYPLAMLTSVGRSIVEGVLA